MSRLSQSNRPLARLRLMLLAPVAKLLSALLPKQGNEFGFVIEKRGELQPWLKSEGGEIGVDREAVRRLGRAPT